MADFSLFGVIKKQNINTIINLTYSILCLGVRGRENIVQSSYSHKKPLNILKFQISDFSIYYQKC